MHTKQFITTKSAIHGTAFYYRTHFRLFLSTTEKIFQQQTFVITAKFHDILI